ncbi:MAG: RNA polymerase sigma factor [Cyclobacteriaceae bacterium]|nr:RNA polymerase sigma factor [Cyclobacteriaceae bacterium]
METFTITAEMALEKRQVVEHTVAKESNRLLNFIKSRVSDKNDAEDILQDVFIQLWQGYQTIESIEKVTAWMFRVARNKIVDLYRKKKPESFSKIENARNSEGDAPMLLAEILVDDSGNPDDVYTRELIWESIEDVLAEMPKPQRDVFVWHELEGLSFKDMEKETGDTLNTLLSRKRYAVQYLRKRLVNLYKEI